MNDRFVSKLKHLLLHPYFPILALIVIYLVIGMLTFKSYGESWDEPKRIGVATQSLKAYLGDFSVLSSTDEKGPFYVMAAVVGAGLLQALHPGWLYIDYWHIMNFLTFLMGVFFLYMICLRFGDKWSALGAALLFSTQPLLWGHAFINPKDIPFMAFFIASVALGLHMTEGFIQRPLANAKTINEAGRFWKRRAFPFLKAIWASLRRKEVWFAAIMLGCCASIRTLGPAAGFIVAIYFFIKARQKSLPTLVAYFCLAAVVSYLTWPAIWDNPLKDYLQSAVRASDYSWSGKVLFAGIEYSAHNLPHSYLPVLLSIQFTETTLLLFLGGVAAAVYKFIKNRIDRTLVTLMGLWFSLPIGMAIIVMPTMYDNFRQFLFTVPPLFIFAGLGLQAVFVFFKKPIFNILLLLLVLAPGVYWDVKLHPYQYIYYNSLVGGVHGAYQKFEMDYWGISYREAGNYLDRVAPLGSQIIVAQLDKIFSSYTRKDLVVKKLKKRIKNVEGSAAYVVQLNRRQAKMNAFANARVIYTVGREGAVYAVVRKLSPGDFTSP